MVVRAVVVRVASACADGTRSCRASAIAATFAVVIVIVAAITIDMLVTRVRRCLASTQVGDQCICGVRSGEEILVGVLQDLQLLLRQTVQLRAQKLPLREQVECRGACEWIYHQTSIRYPQNRRQNAC